MKTYTIENLPLLKLLKIIVIIIMMTLTQIKHRHPRMNQTILKDQFRLLKLFVFVFLFFQKFFYLFI